MKQIFAILFLFFLTFTNATIINIPDDYTTIQEGINASIGADTVLVQPGTYSENLLINRNIVLGSLFLTTADTSYISSTIIHPPGGVVINFSAGDSTCVLTGFTITGGNSIGFGGGIRCVGTSPTISYNIIRDNMVSSSSVCFGGGIFLEYGSSAKIIHNQILNNTATYPSEQGLGGGIYCDGSDPFIANNIINNNASDIDGGGIYFLNSQVHLFNNIVSGNSSQDGGGIYCDGNSAGIISDNVIHSNWSAYNGGGLYCTNSTQSITNNTFCYNESQYGIAALYILGDTIYNNIFYGNIGIYILSGAFYLEHCNIYGNSGDLFALGAAPGTGELTTVNSNGDSCDVYYNILMDPLFADTLNMDFHLTENSPCIDAGDPDFPFDPDGTITDIGAYYFDQIISLDPPLNITVEIIGSSVHLNWDVVTNATSYKVYSSDDPSTGFVEDFSGSFTGESWSTSIVNEKKFYYVIAVRE